MNDRLLHQTVMLGFKSKLTIS